MQETWRWFGPSDSVTLENIVQSGARGVVTALHQIPVGCCWPVEEILERKRKIESQGLVWSVVESLAVHNDIKLRQGAYQQYINAYKDTIANLAETGIKTICYNFMPVVDWTRTNLMYKLPNESYALRFEMMAFIAYDVFVLCRENASTDYSDKQLRLAKQYFETMSTSGIEQLEGNIIAGLPGGEGFYNRESIRAAIDEYREVGDETLRQNLVSFLQEVTPVAEQCGMRLCVHPDDPPFSLFGLPRVVSTAEDARMVLAAVDSPANGLTLCAGSYGARSDNDLVAMVREFGSRIHFVHLRNVTRETDGSFCESEHLDGDNDMVALVAALLDEERRRCEQGRDDVHIPMRPDHGHLMGDDIGKAVKPGYSLLGRVKGLAELRGVIFALQQVRVIEK
jgi:mannonate dehydratase